MQNQHPAFINPLLRLQRLRYQRSGAVAVCFRGPRWSLWLSLFCKQLPAGVRFRLVVAGGALWVVAAAGWR